MYGIPGAQLATRDPKPETRNLETTIRKPQSVIQNRSRGKCYLQWKKKKKLVVLN